MYNNLSILSLSRHRRHDKAGRERIKGEGEKKENSPHPSPLPQRGEGRREDRMGE